MELGAGHASVVLARLSGKQTYSAVSTHGLQGQPGDPALGLTAPADQTPICPSRAWARERHLWGPSVSQEVAAAILPVQLLGNLPWATGWPGGIRVFSPVWSEACSLSTKPCATERQELPVGL